VELHGSSLGAGVAGQRDSDRTDIDDSSKQGGAARQRVQVEVEPTGATIAWNPARSRLAAGNQVMEAVGAGALRSRRLAAGLVVGI
jgi:hypothetical protein